MRTRAWAHKTLNTQLASWTQLRHDTVLYAAQPYANIIGCEYPAGYIEPRIEFWEAMARLPIDGAILSINLQNPPARTVGALDRMITRVNHCRKFAHQMAILREMSRKKLATEPFTVQQTRLIRGTMNSQDHGYWGKSYDGCYPLLFYEDFGQQVQWAEDYGGSNRPDALVTDIHTAPPDEVAGGYPGGVLHEAVGNVDLLLIAVDCRPDRMVYAGPTLSHYEFTVSPGIQRLTDSEWEARLTSNQPARPFWTQDYLVPK